MNALQTTWFILIAVLLTGYTALAGFDLGAGFWHLLARKGEERRAVLNAIGPLWDGNQVWLIAAGGALFAAFPQVYATVFSGFYLALMLVLFALILRSVSIEFGAKERSERGKSRWDVGFAVGSVLAILLFGVAFGNILHGLPLDQAGNMRGAFVSLLNPYALLIGMLNVALLATHGALFLAMKTGGELALRAQRWGSTAWWAYCPLTLVVFGISTTQPHLTKNYAALPVLWLVPALTVVVIVFTGMLAKQGKSIQAFTASSLSIVLLFASASIALFPMMVPAIGHSEWNLTIHNSSSSLLTLRTMAILAGIGMPIVIGYTIWSYRVFRGKVSGEGHY